MRVDYQNRRGDYLASFVNNLINWDFVNTYPYRGYVEPGRGVLQTKSQKGMKGDFDHG